MVVDFDMMLLAEMVSAHEHPFMYQDILLGSLKDDAREAFRRHLRWMRENPVSKKKAKEVANNILE